MFRKLSTFAHQSSFDLLKNPLTKKQIMIGLQLPHYDTEIVGEKCLVHSIFYLSRADQLHK